MRAFVFLCLLAPIMAFQVEFNHSPALSHLQIKQAKIMEDKVEAILECVREFLITGNPETGFPSFNPLDLAELNLNLDNLNSELVSGTVNLKNLHVDGVPGWNLDHLKISITIIPVGAKIVAKITWPAGDLSCDYEANAVALEHSFVGAGHAEGALSNLHFELEAQATINPIQVKSAKVAASVASTNLAIPGLSLNGEDISAGIAEFADNFPGHLAENQGAINDFINTNVLPILNDILANMGNEKFNTYGLAECFAL